MGEEKTPMKAVLGAMEFQRQADIDTCREMTKIMLQNGWDEIDTAAGYAEGNSEKYLGQMNDFPVRIHTKANPKIGLHRAGLFQQCETSLKRTGKDKLDLFYLHMPDHSVPIEETLEAVQELYSEGKIAEFGVSNYPAWQVTQIYYYMKSHGYILPTVYEGRYNAITRHVEKELFPALRALGMRFHLYGTLAGGLLTGKYRGKFNAANDPDSQPKGRFFNISRDKVYRDRFWTKNNFDSVEKIHEALHAAYGDSVSLTEASTRWVVRHSKMDASKGDRIIIGASKVSQLKENIEFMKKGPLDKDVLAAFDAAAALAYERKAVYYFR